MAFQSPWTSTDMPDHFREMTVSIHSTTTADKTRSPNQDHKHRHKHPRAQVVQDKVSIALVTGKRDSSAGAKLYRQKHRSHDGEVGAKRIEGSMRTMQSGVELHGKEKRCRVTGSHETKAKGLSFCWQTPRFILINMYLFEQCFCSDQLIFRRNHEHKESN
jgi:hypothetical protein